MGLKAEWEVPNVWKSRNLGVKTLLLLPIKNCALEQKTINQCLLFDVVGTLGNVLLKICIPT